jgi:membrane protease YdiL (CAAX protease family)
MDGVEIALWLVILFTLVYEPVFGYFDYKRFKQKVKTDDGARVRYYINSVIGLWVPAAFILGLVGFTGITGKDIGFALPGIHTEPLGRAVTYIVLAVALLYAAALLYYAIGYRFSAKIREQTDKAMQQHSEKAGFSDILPVTAREKKWWTFVSVTAGITEEIIYRGFLMFAFSSLFPEWSIWLVILASSALFGLAHTYQGMDGVVRTGLVGFGFALLYAATGSILLPIVLHFLIDMMAKVESGAKKAAHG